MTTLTVTAKGQITLKKEFLTHIGVRPGEKVDVTPVPGGLRMSAAAPRGDISAFFGILHREGQKAFTIEEINEGIVQGAVDSYLRSIGELTDDEDDRAA